MPKFTVWFNKSLSDIVNVAAGLRAADTLGRLKLICSHPIKELDGVVNCDGFYKEPDVLGSAYLAWALQFCQDHKVDVFVCGKQARYLASHVQKFADIGTRLLVTTTSRNYDVLDDKHLAYQHMLSTGLGHMVPAYGVADKASAFKALLGELAPHAPLCFKPTISLYGIGFRVITQETDKTAFDRLLSGDTLNVSEKELASMMADKRSFKPLMVMPFLEGDERSIDCLAHEGRLVACVIRRKVGQGQVLEDNPTLKGYLQELVTAFGLDNFFNAQFRERDGKYYLLEINPRLSGGTHYTFHSGLNLPYLGVMLKLGCITPADIPASNTGMRVVPLERSVALAPAALAA